MGLVQVEAVFSLFNVFAFCVELLTTTTGAIEIALIRSISCYLPHRWWYCIAFRVVYGIFFPQTRVAVGLAVVCVGIIGTCTVAIVLNICY